MSNLKQVVAEYNSILKEEVRQLEEVVKQTEHKIQVYGKLILRYAHTYQRNPAVDYITEVLVQKTDVFLYEKSYKLFAKEGIRDYMKGLLIDEDNRLVLAYFYQFKEAVFKNTKSFEKLARLTHQEINTQTVRYIHRQYNWYMGREMLMFGATYPIGKNFTLRIASKHRSKRKVVGKNRQKVDWGKSFKLLQRLLEDINPELLQQYRDKIIGKPDLIEQAKPYFYNAKDNPTAPKWLVYDDKDFDFWLVLRYPSSVLENKMFYGVTPTNAIHNETRSQHDFLKGVKTIEDIIDSKIIGFREKIVMLERFDLTHCLNTFGDGI